MRDDVMIDTTRYWTNKVRVQVSQLAEPGAGLQVACN
jgi:hypothetical protein